MLTSNSRTRFISWQELEEMIVSLSQEVPFSDIAYIDERSQIPAVMLQYRTGGDMDISGKRFSIFSGTDVDVCLFKIFNEDEAKYSKWDGIFFEEIIVPINEQPPEIIMPWEKV